MLDKLIANNFATHNILLKNLVILQTSEFCKKRGLVLFFGVNVKGFYTLVLWREAKSRLVVKEFLELEEICRAVEAKMEFSIKKRICFYKSAICSKVVKSAKESGFKLYEIQEKLAS